MYILGIYNGHNATATLIKDGEVIAAASEERFNGVKNFKGFPQKAVGYCLNEAGIKASELDLVVRSTTIGSPIHTSEEFKKDSLINTMHNLHRFVNPGRVLWGELSYRFPVFRKMADISYTIAAKTAGKMAIEREMDNIASRLGVDRKKIRYFDHHDSHAFAAYYSSPFNKEKVLVLALDGEGDDCSATVYIFEGGDYKEIARSPRGASLGLIYARVTEHLGMKASEHEYKVMGLAPYAKDEDVTKVYKRIKDIIFLDKKNPLIFRSPFNTTDTGKFLSKMLKGVRFDILAGAFQKLIEEKTIEWVNNAITKTGITTVVLCGGVFMNVKANQLVYKQKKVKKIFIMPSCGDESTPLGACFYALINKFHYDSNKIKPMGNIYWGPSFNNPDVEKVIKKRNIKGKYFVKKVEDIEKVTARLLSEGKIVARLKGRMEFGARALGDRSILANPKDTDTVRIINEQVKNRDFWMPFAPSIAYDRAQDYLQNPKKEELSLSSGIMESASYMMIAFDSTPLARKELKAAMHPYDFTLRPQVVKKESNSSYYKLIKEFEKLTGIGAVLNTSFNLHGFPIVLGPDEALDAFENSGLEYLTLENYLIAKSQI